MPVGRMPKSELLRGGLMGEDPAQIGRSFGKGEAPSEPGLPGWPRPTTSTLTNSSSDFSIISQRPCKR
jgi:hypothetical protein